MSDAAMDVLNLDEMFDSKPGDEWRPEWMQALFERAFFEGSGAFRHVCERLRLGYSVLAYVPGNCMGAAAAVVQKHLGDNYGWTEYLEHPGTDGTLDQVWIKTPGLVSTFVAWRNSQSGKPPAAIFHNLDFLTDGRGGVYQHLAAQTALAALVSGTRQGVVLGLSDRDEPPLPSAISRAFSEHIRIDEIPYENFSRVMPVEVGEKLQNWRALTEGAIWLIASRLRWTDPARVHRILKFAHQGQNGLEGLFHRIVDSTQTVNFQSADQVYDGANGRPTGVSEALLTALETSVIRPYQRWKEFRGDRAAYVRALAKLPPGLILHGPPGTGKTHLARWIASEVELPVRLVNGPDLRSGIYSETERNVRALFREVRRAAPCVLIMDDADDLLPARSEAQGSVASVDRAVVNEFLQQLQGVRGRLEGVLVILTTNRFESLDAAARTRLPIHHRVPYPPDAHVGALVDVVAREYDYTLAPDVRQRLVELFLRPLGAMQGGREAANAGYFSPREIQQAMRMLDTYIGVAGAAYSPTAADVERVTTAYKDWA